MPTHAPNTSFSPHDSEITQSNVACPAPLTPPPEVHGNETIRRIAVQQTAHDRDGISRRPVGDNTAAGMSLMQEESMYTTPPSLDEKVHAEIADHRVRVDGAGNDAVGQECIEQDEGPYTEEHQFNAHVSDVVEGGDRTSSSVQGLRSTAKRVENVEVGTGLLSPPLTSSPDDATRSLHGPGHNAGIASIDQKLDWANNDLRPWEFSHRRIRPQYPSATFQPYSKFKGTQQSDRQIYNVEVTILTVDIEQCSMSGYLQICGLTPDHPTLTTFFTGEIIGGPDQKYSFRTKDASWGASDKTDLTHWARFPAWRPLSLHAKRNINFVYPMNHENWWQQEYIFMRWKEHFLVPDYKLKSIQGASFEGFYYICFNQIEGRVSGIYFHSKSEK